MKERKHPQSAMANLKDMASILWIPAAFSVFSFYLYYLSTHLPPLSETNSVNSSALTFPSNLAELVNLADLLNTYKKDNAGYVTLLFSSAYVFKQMFAIPGSVFLNVLAGALFGQWVGFFMACVLSAGGATMCYLLSKLCGKHYIQKYFPDKLNFMQNKIEENMDSLFFFLLFLRLFPMTPNWFLNISSPILNVPIHLFFLSVFVGLMPYNFICVQAGCFLSQLTSIENLFTFWTLLKLLGVANMALLPGILIKHYHMKRQQARRENAKKES